MHTRGVSLGGSIGEDQGGNDADIGTAEKGGAGRRKVHEGMQKHAIRRGVFVTLDGGRQIKAHEDMVKPDTWNRFKPHEG
jgi:hypothetical protein